MPSGDTPKSPDYVGAAKEQGKQNLLAAVQTGFMNNPNINNPYGSQTVKWSKTGGTKGKFVGTGKNKKWVARIVFGRKKTHLGYFINEIEAHNAYQDALKNPTNI